MVTTAGTDTSLLKKAWERLNWPHYGHTLILSYWTGYLHGNPEMYVGVLILGGNKAKAPFI